MSVPTVPVSEPTLQSEPAPETATNIERAPLRELLPAGNDRLITAAAAVALVVGSFMKFGFSGTAVLGAVLCPTLVLLAAIDVKHRLLPNEIILTASLAVGLVVAASTPGSFLSHLAAGAAFGGFFFLFGTVFAGSLGMGDAKLGFLVGLALGAKTFGAAMIAFAALLVAALYVLARRGVSARKDTLPFGPFLALGGILAFFLS
jgi:prepilin signal peptidase PulO-like enzyme (type II secretory pathway)